MTTPAPRLLTPCVAGLLVAALGLGLGTPALALSRNKTVSRMANATAVLEEVLNIPEQGIPDKLLAGSEAVIANLPAVQLGMTVCYDVRFPDLFRTLAWAGAKIIAVPAAFTRITGEAHWHILLRSRAIETGCFIIAPAQGGKHEDGRETYGHSLIIDPWGAVLAEGGVDPGVIIATLDLDKVDEVRGKVPSLKHVRPFRAVGS